MFKQREGELTRIACMLRDLLLVESAMYGTGSKVPCPWSPADQFIAPVGFEICDQIKGFRVVGGRAY